MESGLASSSDSSLRILGLRCAAHTPLPGSLQRYVVVPTASSPGQTSWLCSREQECTLQMAMHKTCPLIQGFAEMSRSNKLEYEKLHSGRQCNIELRFDSLGSTFQVSNQAMPARLFKIKAETHPKQFGTWPTTCQMQRWLLTPALVERVLLTHRDTESSCTNHIKTQAEEEDQFLQSHVEGAMLPHGNYSGEMSSPLLSGDRTPHPANMQKTASRNASRNSGGEAAVCPDEHNQSSSSGLWQWKCRGTCCDEWDLHNKALQAAEERPLLIAAAPVENNPQQQKIYGPSIQTHGQACSSPEGRPHRCIQYSSGTPSFHAQEQLSHPNSLRCNFHNSLCVHWYQQREERLVHMDQGKDSSKPGRDWFFLRCPSLDTLQHLNVSLVVRGPKLNTGFEGWRLNHFPGQPVPMLDNPFSEVKSPNIQSKPPLAQLEAISSCTITCYFGEETDPHLATPSFQVVVESDKVSPQPPLLQTKQPQFPQPLLMRLLL
ncbi:hypothetical protein QYF61_016121 [Mycteria americana]|uniref:Uncharacterized protein n=1 Tax=Mycteria americana TaxID=33587 RepID=A0AAN7NPC7_MYCAM|nr:hypothetical protein QYF61_016121 [Mycteria americana]